MWIDSRVDRLRVGRSQVDQADRNGCRLPRVVLRRELVNQCQGAANVVVRVAGMQRTDLKVVPAERVHKAGLTIEGVGGRLTFPITGTTPLRVIDIQPRLAMRADEAYGAHLIFRQLMVQAEMEPRRGAVIKLHCLGRNI